MAYKPEDFGPMISHSECGCERHGYLIPCHIFFLDEKNIRHHVCFRQQCPYCDFVRKNRIGKPMYYDIIDSNSKIERFVFLPEYFTAPDEYTFDEQGQYDKAKKINFMRRILTLANKNQHRHGHLDFTREEIESVKIA